MRQLTNPGSESARAGLDGVGVPTVTSIQKRLIADAHAAGKSLSKTGALRIAKRIQQRIRVTTYADPTGEAAVTRAMCPHAS